GPERRCRAARPRRSRRPAPGRTGRRRAFALARRGVAAAGRRTAHQRRVQREPRLDAGSARAPGRERWTQGGSPRRDGRAGADRPLRLLERDEAAPCGVLSRTQADKPGGSLRPCLACSSRPRSSPAPPGRPLVERVLAAGIFAMAISILAGPKFIDFLRRNEF